MFPRSDSQILSSYCSCPVERHHDQGTELEVCLEFQMVRPWSYGGKHDSKQEGMVLMLELSVRFLCLPWRKKESEAGPGVGF